MPLYQESRINILEGEIELLEAKLLKDGDKITNGNNGTSEEILQNRNNEKTEKELLEKVCKLTAVNMLS